MILIVTAKKGGALIVCVNWLCNSTRYLQYSMHQHIFLKIWQKMNEKSTSGIRTYFKSKLNKHTVTVSVRYKPKTDFGFTWNSSLLIVFLKWEEIMRKIK